MKPLTAEWVAKAEGDFATACREAAVADAPNWDAVCFHAEQRAEKYLKARIVEAGASFPKTHDLTVLLDLVLVFEPGWGELRASLEALTDAAVEFRYPGYSADETDASAALAAATALRAQARDALDPSA
ncbi:MAG: HEPN domain-containing protein [Deltaproteobacteria bacterium]|nr:HEPN domain-containing protein [Deltaproteobacteria bacterium]